MFLFIKINSTFFSTQELVIEFQKLILKNMELKKMFFQCNLFDYQN